MNSRSWSIGSDLVPLDTTYSLEKFQEFSHIIIGAHAVNVHTDDDFARSVGHRQAIGFGPQLTAQVYRMLVANFGEAARPSGSLSVSFMRPFYSGETVTAKGRIGDVVDVSEQSSMKELVIDVWCEDPTGAKVMAGRATAFVNVASVEL